MGFFVNDLDFNFIAYQNNLSLIRKKTMRKLLLAGYDRKTKREIVKYRKYTLGEDYSSSEVLKDLDNFIILCSHQNLM